MRPINQTIAMNLKITSLFVFFTFFTAVAQETYQVSGKLIASDTEKAVSFANAVLLQDGEVVKGSSSETSGVFVIENITTGTYTLTISFLGYKNFSNFPIVENGKKCETGASSNHVLRVLDVVEFE